ncbi:MAG: hypothetical protein ACOYZ7_07550 [Chloroflexota bacterium]
MSQRRDGGSITLFTGRFGSGKTEIAINYALSLASGAGSLRPILVDLDIVTPYFRSREMAGQLAQEGVDVVTPAAVSQHLDTPGIGPEILGAIEQQQRPVVMDVGGDAQGARALGQFAPALQRLGYAMNFVVNPHRPFTDTVEGIARAVTEIQATSRLTVTALVSNPNLMRQTTIELVVAGHRVVEQAAAALNLPLALICLRADLAAQVPPGTFAQPLLPLRRFFVMPWEASESDTADDEIGGV